MLAANANDPRGIDSFMDAGRQAGLDMSNRVIRRGFHDYITKMGLESFDELLEAAGEFKNGAR